MRSQTNRFLLLKESLDRLHKGVHPSHLASDPLWYVHRYETPEDREVVAFLAAVFAYGQVSQILRNLQRVLAPLSDAAARKIREGTARDWNRAYRRYAYRFQQRQDLTLLLCLLKRVLQDFGTIQASFLTFYLPHSEAPSPIRRALTGWVAYLRETLPSCLEGTRIEDLRGIHHLLPDPASGSACKRWNLFLRWMVRGPDGMDLGLWRAVSTRHLILPLDTHTARICRYLRLTNRTTPGWAMAEEITRNLRQLDPDDPVRYDFSIAHMGIQARCTRKVDRKRCRSCELSGSCHATEHRRPRTPIR
jgi:uncharacterized protein (TIGR02757 family)